MATKKKSKQFWRPKPEGQFGPKWMPFGYLWRTGFVWYITVGNVRYDKGEPHKHCLKCSKELLPGNTILYGEEKQNIIGSLHVDCVAHWCIVCAREVVEVKGDDSDQDTQTT